MAETREIREKEPQKRKHEEVEAKILEVAINLFARKGFEGASVRDITAAAKVTVPTLYYHFKDKDGLYQAALKESAEIVIREVMKTDDPNASLRDRLITSAKAKLRLYAEEVDAMRLCVRNWLDSGAFSVPSDLKIILAEAFKLTEEEIEWLLAILVGPFPLLQQGEG